MSDVERTDTHSHAYPHTIQHGDGKQHAHFNRRTGDGHADGYPDHHIDPNTHLNSNHCPYAIHYTGAECGLRV